MAKPRSPDLDVAEITGSKAKNPSRFKTQGGIHSPPLGAPSRQLSDDEKRCWESFKIELPHLCEADRAIVEMACELRAKQRRGELNQFSLGQYRSILVQLGGSPVSRKNVKVLPTDDGNGNDGQFFS